MSRQNSIKTKKETEQNMAGKNSKETRRNSKDTKTETEQDGAGKNSKETRRNSKDTKQETETRRNSKDTKQEIETRRNSKDTKTERETRRNSKDTKKETETRRNSKDTKKETETRRNSKDTKKETDTRRNSTEPGKLERQKSGKKSSETKNEPKRIDASRAMVIMGFKTSRTLEAAKFDERRQILDAQLFTRMQEVQKYEEKERQRKEREAIQRIAEERLKEEAALSGKKVVAGVTVDNNERRGSLMKKDSFKKNKSGGDKNQSDNSLKNVDLRTLHEAYNTLLKKYCPEEKKKEDTGSPKDDSPPMGMMGF